MSFMVPYAEEFAADGDMDIASLKIKAKEEYDVIVKRSKRTKSNSKRSWSRRPSRQKRKKTTSV